MHWLHYIALLAVVLATVRPVGLYLARVFERGPTFLDRFLCPVESRLYQIVGLDRDQEMSARVYMRFRCLRRCQHRRAVRAALVTCRADLEQAGRGCGSWSCWSWPVWWSVTSPRPRRRRALRNFTSRAAIWKARKCGSASTD